MRGNERVPVRESGKSHRIERGRLAQLAAVAARRDLELEPRTARQLHLGGQSEACAGHNLLHAPEVERIANTERPSFRSAATHADTAEQQVDRATQPP